MKTRLKPCPFCGGAAKLSETDFDGFFVFCESCRASFFEVTKKKSVDAWNRRAETAANNFEKVVTLLTEARDVLGETIAELRTENARLKKELAEAKGERE